MSRRHFSTLFFASLAIITWLALTPDGPRIPGVEVNDKLQHVAAFVWLTLLAHCSFPGTRLRYMAALLLGYGALIEVAQYFIPMRSASLSDIIADLAGIGIGAMLLRYACVGSCRI